MGLPYLTSVEKFPDLVKFRHLTLQRICLTHAQSFEVIVDKGTVRKQIAVLAERHEPSSTEKPEGLRTSAYVELRNLFADVPQLQTP